MTMNHTNLIERLKPCPVPWCGSSALRLLITSSGGRRVYCRTCQLFAPEFPTEDEAIFAWNTRTNAQAISTLTAALEDARKRFQMIADFGDPYEINDEPEDFGGTDDGTETVCMAYENMQCIAENALRSISATLTKGDSK